MCFSLAVPSTKREYERLLVFCKLIVRDSSASLSAFDQLSYKVRRNLKGHQGKILCLDWARNGQKLISSSQVTNKYT